ncbi:uncharacterized protein LOC106525872 [Austrofundulus limnaeus]|uniref:Gypsy retrotransposon integrase-like protein 1 n=1 Tax=Austrofundulus limnaeus TaxID=52670 RepID=A0A2I4C6W7_AUSLI|nr:PREDICTED: uncharacterized protein LOC106525872 [Austrofundulus limnaeus]
MSGEVRKTDLNIYSPFLMKGEVSVAGGEKVPVTILRDTAASRSIILNSVLPLSDETSLNSFELVQGFGMKFVNVPLHRVHLKSELLSGEVVLAASPVFPINGVDLLLGNDFAGGKILVNPDVTAVPVFSDGPDELQIKFPKLFPMCAITRAMAHNSAKSDADAVVNLEDSFMSDLFLDQDSHLDSVNAPVTSSHSPPQTSPPDKTPDDLKSRENLILEQSQDPSLSSLFSRVLSHEEIKNVPVGVFCKDGILMRKWTPPHASAEDDWCVVNQIVVPQKLCPSVLSLAHDNFMAAHLGVNKTYDCILRQFFWPGLKSDVKNYCKTCGVCQISGKPNQKIPPYPFHPVPAVDGPFDQVLVDCVGPLPRTKSGNKFLLTIMCAATRFPEAIPLRKITAPTVH